MRDTDVIKFCILSQLFGRNKIRTHYLSIVRPERYPLNQLDSPFTFHFVLNDSMFLLFLWVYFCAGQDVKEGNLENGDRVANSIVLNQPPLTSTIGSHALKPWVEDLDTSCISSKQIRLYLTVDAQYIPIVTTCVSHYK